MKFSFRMSLAACFVGAACFMTSAGAQASVRIINTADNATKVVDSNKARMNSSTRVVENQKGSSSERINSILHPDPPANADKAGVVTDMDSLFPVVNGMLDESSIMGGAMATPSQCVRYLLRNNPNPNISCTPEELVSYYYEEGSREGVRPDVAFTQALKETGFFRYGGTVVPAQNNYCGLGTTSATVRGAYFATAQLGVRAHIQHLLAYASTRRPSTEVVDPRYQLVRSTYGSRTLNDWQDLNGRWAVPGNGYGQSILSMYNALRNS